jgi:hypothetical protein
MKKFAILMLLALELAVCGCGSNTLANPNQNTASTATWEAQLVGGTGPASALNFLSTFNVQDNGTATVPLDIPSTGISFINAGACFANGVNVLSAAGNATFSTNTGTGQVTGQLNLTVTSVTPAGNVLALTSYQGGLTGTSNATTTTTGTLTNGVVVGTWQLTSSGGIAGCTGSGTFVMCQGKSSCTPP